MSNIRTKFWTSDVISENKVKDFWYAELPLQIYPEAHVSYSPSSGEDFRVGQRYFPVRQAEQVFDAAGINWSGFHLLPHIYFWGQVQ